MERIIYKHLFNHLHANNLIFKNQSGFLPKHSTVYQLIDIYNQICKGYNDKQFTSFVFCDISKAFDRVWHRGLLHKLKENGINHKVLNWISNYLSKRSQSVFVGNSSSKAKYISAGVPQGSVLGPLFFLIYVNDITESLQSVTRLFADDSSLATTSNNPYSTEVLINTDLSNILEWSKQWLVNFNPAKTESMFCSLANFDKPKLTFDNHVINSVDFHKHLGLTLSCDGTWHNHIQNIIASTNKILGSMKALKFKLHRKTLNQIYLAYLRPHLEYGSIVWDNCTTYEKELLEKIQYEAARIVTGLTRSVSNTTLINETGWITLEQRRKIQKLILVYKYTRGELPSYLSNLFPPYVRDVNQYNLRNSDDFAIIPARLEIFKNSTIPSSVSLWNALDSNTKNSENLNSFKRKLNSIYKGSNVPSFFITGDRYYSVIHCRLRNKCSNLNFDLYTNHLRDDPFCEYCNEPEDSEHFLLRCRRYNDARLIMFQNTRPYHTLSTIKLLYGNPMLNDKENAIIFKEVQRFIKSTGRFRQ